MQLRNLQKLDRLEAGFRGTVEALLERWALDPWLAVHRIEIMITDGWRSPEEQFAKFRQGRELRDGRWVVVGKTVTKLAAGAHNLGMAIDAAPWRGGRLLYPDVLVKEGAPAGLLAEADEAFRVMGSHYEAVGLTWGGRWGESVLGAGDGWDRPHGEDPRWKDVMAGAPST